MKRKYFLQEYKFPMWLSIGCGSNGHTKYVTIDKDAAMFSLFELIVIVLPWCWPWFVFSKSYRIKKYPVNYSNKKHES